MKGIPNTPKIEMTIFTHGYGIVNFATIQWYVWEVVKWVGQIGVSHQEHFEGRQAHLVFERAFACSLETYREKDRDDLVSSLRLLKFK